MRLAIYRIVLLLGGCLLLVLGAVVPASAIPAFARKYGYNCTMCHSNFPRLNDWGTRYRQNGYQVPGRENAETTVLEGPAPFAMRTSAGFNSDRFPDDPGAEEVSQFQINGLDLMSAGLLGRNIGYMAMYLPQISGSRGLVAQDGTVEMANVIFARVGSSPLLNARLGRFEPAYAAFSVKRQLSVSPYEIYQFVFPGGPAFSDTQDGLELTGYAKSHLSYALGWLNGSGTNNSDDAPQDFYVRVAQVFGQGEGQTAGQRLGVTAYLGRARPDSSLPAAGLQNFRRWAIDASLNAAPWNLALQYLQGSDDAALWNLPEQVDFSGGFAELSYLPTTNLVGFARYDRVSVPDLVGSDLDRWTLGGRYYFRDNLALHLEYSHRAASPADPEVTENLFTTRLDWAF